MIKIKHTIVLTALLGMVSTFTSRPTDAQTSSFSIRSLGLAVPRDQVLIRSEIDGHVARICFREGEFVKKGQVVVQLEAEPAEARRKIAQLESSATGQIQNALAVLEVARTNHERILLLQKKQASSAQEVSEAVLRLRQAEASVTIENERALVSAARFELAEAELNRYYLKAPFDGQIVHVHAGMGQSITSSDNLLRVVSLDFFRVDLFLPVSTANHYAAGQEIRVNIGAPFHRTVDAIVLFRSPIFEAATSTTRLTIEIDNRKLNLESGFTVSLADDLAVEKTPFKTVGSTFPGDEVDRFQK